MEYWMCKVDGLLRERKQERESPVPTPRRWEEEDLIVQNQEGEIPCLKLAQEWSLIQEFTDRVDGKWGKNWSFPSPYHARKLIFKYYIFVGYAFNYFMPGASVEVCRVLVFFQTN